MLRLTQVKLPLTYSEEDLISKCAGLLRIQPGKIKKMELVRRSVDARKKPCIVYSCTVDVTVDGERSVLKNSRCRQAEIVKRELYHFPKPGGERLTAPIIIVGMGPAGLFCGYLLAKAGYRPILLERGQDVDSRKAAVEKFWETGILNPSSNVQFGEGGAGTFSDGKLNTTIKDQGGRNRKALEIFVENGAPEEILYEAKPHIGTDILFHVVKNMRQRILAWGGQVRFESCVTDIFIKEERRDAIGRLWTNDGNEEPGKAASQDCEGNEEVSNAVSRDCEGNEEVSTAVSLVSEGNEEVSNAVSRVSGVEINGKERLACSSLVLAPGHSARDTFSLLFQKKIPMEPKPFAVGFRVIHPQSLINESQYGAEELKPLGAAPYKLTARSLSGRGVYSFCMCPGGYVVNASSEPGHTAVNGMSYHDRAGRFANSAVIVTVNEKDVDGRDALSGMRFQRELEKRAYELGAGAVPVERYGDFYESMTASNGENIAYAANEAFQNEAFQNAAFQSGASQVPPAEEPEEKAPIRKAIGEPTDQCIKGKAVSADLTEILPQELNKAFVEGKEHIDKIIPGCGGENTLLCGVESRTSSPVRILRKDTLESAAVAGLYPCGEGAGYAGGIMSAAVDGMKAAEELASRYSPFFA
ncbi:MAG: FAD-dependent oxidoreductase [Lachnospiraceae bacterium]|nr:FAD-dependent oxidoreductase [Lachnospiraceae bacterium]